MPLVSFDDRSEYLVLVFQPGPRGLDLPNEYQRETLFGGVLPANGSGVGSLRQTPGSY